MARRVMTPVRYAEIQRRLKLGHRVREIARALGCSRVTVRGIRDGQIPPPDKPKALAGPVWSEQVEWEEVARQVRLGTPLKFLWEERGQDKVSYVNFWKQFCRRFPQYRQPTVTIREFAAGDRVEVDYAGWTVPWQHRQSGSVFQAPVFVAALGFSQLVFATCREDAKSASFLECHNRMYRAFGGVPRITVPDCLKTGVSKCDLYDPDINSAYNDLATHYGTAIVPARPARPKDKAIVENSVKLLKRFFLWRYRGRIFSSTAQIDAALRDCCKRINERPHTRFRVSRLERWEKVEKKALLPLPSEPFEPVQWKQATLHPDCHISLESAYYSAPHIHRGKRLRVKLTANHVEIYCGLERVALHSRDRRRAGRYHTQMEHLPENSRAYREATPQNVLSQCRFLHPGLHRLVDELFEQNTLGHLRRSMGFIRESRKHINLCGPDTAKSHITKAILQMRAYQKIRVPYFRELLAHYHKQPQKTVASEIERRGENPMLRYHNPKQGGDDVSGPNEKPAG